MTWYNPLTWFKNKEERTYPSGHFGIIVLSDSARKFGIKDDKNKIIEHYKQGALFKTYQYSKEKVEALKITYNMPIVEVDNNKDEEFEFDTIADFGFANLKKHG